MIAVGMIGAPVCTASLPAPWWGDPSASGRSTHVPSGNTTTSPPSARIARAVSSASPSASPRRTGNAPHRRSSHPSGPLNSSVLAIKRTRRRVAVPTKNTSKKFLWLGAMIAGPLRGMRSPPRIRTRNQSRSTTNASNRPHEYSGPDKPRPRAYAWRCAQPPDSPHRRHPLERDRCLDPPELSAPSAVGFGSGLNPDHRVLPRDSHSREALTQTRLVPLQADQAIGCMLWRILALGEVADRSDRSNRVSARTRAGSCSSGRDRRGLLCSALRLPARRPGRRARTRILSLQDRPARLPLSRRQLRCVAEYAPRSAAALP